MCLFERYRRSLGIFVIRFKVMDAGVALKPSPLMRGEMQAVAEDATSGCTTILYGRVAAFVRALSGVRDPTVAAWTWEDISFVPTVIVTKGEGTAKDTHEVLAGAPYMICCMRSSWIGKTLHACMTPPCAGRLWRGCAFATGQGPKSPGGKNNGC